MKKWNNPAVRFSVTFLALFFLLYYFHIFYNGLVAPGGLYSPFLAEHLNYIKWLRHFLLFASSGVLSWLGYYNITNDMALLTVGRGSIILAYNCLGLGVMSFLISFILTYPKPWKSKLLFLIPGLVFIQVLNIARFVLLALYWRQLDKKWNLDHHTIFNIVVYLFIFTTLYIWIKPKKKPISQL
jgi:exosortase/archaeosortase family protein